MTPYSRRARLQVYPPPLHCLDARIDAFVLPAERDALARLLDLNLNEASGGALRFEPLAGAVVLAFVDIPRITHGSSKHAHVGSIRERECAIWVPAVQLEGGRVRRLCWTVPYMFVDEGFSLSAGREFFGFPKQLGEIGLPDRGELLGAAVGARRWSVDSEAVRRFGPGARAELQRLIAVHDGGEDPAAGGDLDWTDLLAALPQPRLGAGLSARMLAELRRRELSIVLLRQIPDVSDPSRAAHKSIACFPARPLNTPRVRPLGGAPVVEIDEADTHPLIRELGLSPRLRPLASARLELDFELDLGETLWSASSSARVEAPTPAAGPRRVAIVGGGIAGLATAFELSDEPNWRERYAITIYQKGWRLGGHAASGRDLGQNKRSLEHGLHVWFGFYLNAFSILGRCYRELGRSEALPLARIEDAFAPIRAVTYNDFAADDPWTLDYGDDDARPWAEEPPPLLPSPRALLTRALRTLLRELLARGVGEGLPDALVARLEALPPARSGPLRKLLARLGRHAGGRSLALAVAVLERAPVGRELGGLRELLVELLEGARRFVLERVEARAIHSLAHRHLAISADASLTLAIGVLRDRLLARGFSAVDDLDLRAWMAGHGGKARMTESAPMAALYDAAFAYEDGELERPRMAAGAGALAVLRLAATFKGALMWKMQAGMGEVVIAPLYELLRRRGVEFRFFHELSEIQASEDGERIASVEFLRQAQTHGPDYEPLILVRETPAWPAAPRYEQLQAGDALRDKDPEALFEAGEGTGEARLRLRADEDFDDLVLALPAPILARLGAPLASLAPQWRALAELPTVATHSVALWLSDEAPAWARRSTLSTCHPHPFASWLLLEDVLERDAPGAAPVRLLHCSSACPDGTKKQDVAAALEAFLEEHGADLLARSRIRDRYLRVNHAGVDRYAQALPGTIDRRMDPLDTGFSNLYVAGAWTRCGFHITSIESAAISARLVAAAIAEREPAITGLRPTLDTKDGSKQA